VRARCLRELNSRASGGPYSGLVPCVRTVKTKSGATVVQVVFSSRQGSTAWPDGRGCEELKTAASLAPVEGERLLLLSRLLDVRSELA
jgi:hypothetical protein